MNKIFAFVFGALAAIAFYGAAFCAAPWHYPTFIICLFLALLFLADSSKPKKPGIAVK